ncbi:MAG TPA: 2OG-Fe(II) oxygenase [Chthoniobacteraceae bacterium]|jgi:hypothetical protein|nr:2OG-Fe(II) oxygenase [Chthoniobacteraceae bacterium]
MADDSIHIEYNRDLRALEALLSEVTRAGDFLVHGPCEVPMPKVVVEGVGAVSIPVPPAQIEALIQHAVRAPYGRGEETILDETVRKVWQLAPDKVEIGGKSWAANFAGILQQVAAGLGCEGLPISAELYKLLIYDEGGFFLAHRDTEKVEGMFATLVLTLPSEHEGGELVIRHAGREVTVDLSRAEFSELAFAAFYADCEHEVKPIRRGNRVCLVYNLIQQCSRKGAEKALTAPGYDAQTAAVAALLGEAFRAPAPPAKVAWLLEHQYSPDGLSFSGLKSADAARAKVLSEAAQLAVCVTHVCLVHIEEVGSAEGVYDGYRGRGRYDDDDGETDEEFEVLEVCDSYHYLDQWRDVRDRPAGFGRIPLAPGELLPAGALDGEAPDEQRFTEASGNEGATFERSYLRAALVVWPRVGTADVLLQAGPAAALPWLRELVEAACVPSAGPDARAEAISVARQIVAAWLDLSPYSPLRQEARERAELLGLFVRLGDPTLLQDYIREVVTADYDGSENQLLVSGAGLLPVVELGSLYSGLLWPNMRLHFACCLGLCMRWFRARRECSVERAGERP